MLYSLLNAALACGGLMCNGGPTTGIVVQNAERIAFLVDEDAGMVEAHVQILYQGEPDAFAWVVPVAVAPEVFLSSQSLFDALSQDLAPTFSLNRTTEGTCRGERRISLGCTEYALSADVPNDFDGMPTGGVQVEAAGQVGPYDHVVLQADGADVLVDWLQTNGFAVPDGLDTALAPYVVPGGHFVAVRLQKDRDTGDIAPLAFRYPAEHASIPIQLTALASAPDLRLEVSVFGASRAVPRNYLHVKVDEAAIDWWNGGQNYYDVVARAADQAGGHAFATDYAGPTDPLRLLWTRQLEDAVAGLHETTDPVEWAARVAGLGIPVDGNAVAALAPWVQIVNDGSTLDVTGLGFDAEEIPAVNAALEAFVFEPRRRVQALADSPYVTRMASSLDAEEMTVDPLFELTTGLPDVSNQHAATDVTDCQGNSKDRASAPHRLELADGRVIHFPGQDEAPDPAVWLATERPDRDALVIEQFEGGIFTLLVDLASDDREARGDGHGCAVAPGGSLLLGGLLALGVRRRRTA